MPNGSTTTSAASGTHRPGARLRQWPAKAGRWCRDALRIPGQERHTVLLLGKSTLAATLAWVIAHDVLHTQSPAFAPFSAVLIMQVTIYQSLDMALRYAGAVTAGVAVQAGLGFLAGPDVLTFVVVCLIALVIGRWPVLGSQGSQVVTAAFFAFATYASATDSTSRFLELGEIILMVVMGCGIGVLVNMLIVPPLRYRSAEYGIRALANALGALLSDMVPVLRDGGLDRENTSRWRDRAAGAESLVMQARSHLRTAEESQYFNPRRLLPRYRSGASFTGYQAVLEAMERALYQCASLARSLDRWEVEETHFSYAPFLASYADFLESLATVTEILGALDEDRLPEQAEELKQRSRAAEECRRAVADRAQAEQLPLADPVRPYGVLVVEAARLMEEFRNTGEVLQHQVDRMQQLKGRTAP